MADRSMIRTIVGSIICVFLLTAAGWYTLVAAKCHEVTAMLNEHRIPIEYSSRSSDRPQSLCDELQLCFVDGAFGVSFFLSKVDSDKIDYLAARLVIFPQLKRIDVRDCNISDVGIEALSRCRMVEHVEVCWSSRVTPQGVQTLLRLPKLRRLVVDSRQVSPELEIEFTKRGIQLDVLRFIEKTAE